MYCDSKYSLEAKEFGKDGMIQMAQIELEFVEDGPVEECRELCNALMAYQKSLAKIAPWAFDGMNFETRLKLSYERSPLRRLIVARDKGRAVGYVFSTVEAVKSGDKSGVPDWAPVTEGEKVMGFYPDWENLPDQVGCLNQLYVREEYRGGLGERLLRLAMQWMEETQDRSLSFVYISNGNERALDFYRKHGFAPSHDVFGGFIRAACRRRAW